MFRIILIITLITPFLGIIMMEMGAYGIDVGMYGYPNGASVAYFIYILCFFITYNFFGKDKYAFSKFSKKKKINNKVNHKLIHNRFKLGIYFLLLFLLIMLFVFGGINVVLGNIGKGEFRGSFGFFGAIPFYITKLFAPAITTFLSGQYVTYKDKVKGILSPFLLSVFLCFLIGATWGYKSTAVMLMLPVTIVIWKNISLKKFIIVSILGLSIFTAFAVFYDSREFTVDDVKTTITDFSIEKTFDLRNLNAFSAVLYRLTVVQGNSVWRIWDLYELQVPMPNYWKTFSSVFGDKVLAIGGITRAETQDFIETHYSAATTDLIRKSAGNEKFDYNVTVTAFTDGVLIGGMPGVIFIGLLAGYFTRLIRRKILFYLFTQNFIALSLISVFFTSYFRSWLNSGGVTSLIHISLFVGIGITYFFLIFFEKLSKSNI